MDEYGRNKLHDLIIDSPESEHEKYISVLAKDGIDINQQDTNGWTPLHFAVQENSILGVKELLRLGAKIDLTDSYGNTALHKATFESKGEGEIIKQLLRAGSNPDHENNHGVSPRTLALTIDNYDVKQFFK